MNLDKLNNPYLLSREELKEIRFSCDSDLLYFTRLFYYILRGTKFIVSEHHEELSMHFEEVDSYKVKLLNINIPPRHSKTELALNFIARGIGKNQSSNWLYISASDELRAEASTRIRDIVTHPLYFALYGLTLKKDQNSKNLWRTTKGGGLKTATIFGQVTGFGAGQMTEAGFNKDSLDLIRDFEGCQVWDDLNKTEDSQAENANNDKVSRVIFNTLLSRENSHDTPIIHIQQRTGMSDATASLMEHYGRDDDKYRFVVMPIIKDDGQPLWASKFPLEEIYKIKKSPKTSHVFEAQYMQDPQPSDGAMFRKDELNYFSIDQIDEDRIKSRLGAIDVADEGKDYLSFPSGCLIGTKFYVTDWIYTQDNMKTTIPQAASIINANKINHVGVETNSFGITFFRELEESVTNYTTVYPNYETFNKHSRIINREVFIKDFFVFRNDVDERSDYGKAMRNLTRYMRDKSYKIDDAPDSLASLATLLLELFEE